jgi:hypothetical protein
MKISPVKHLELKRVANEASMVVSERTPVNNMVELDLKQTAPVLPKVRRRPKPRLSTQYHAVRAKLQALNLALTHYISRKVDGNILSDLMHKFFETLL